MSEFNIEVAGGTSVRLPVGGKYCDRDIIITSIDISDIVEPVIEPLDITENGTYTVPDGVDGYSPVTVNVPIPDGYIQPNGALDITENGTHNVTEYAEVNVTIDNGTNTEAEELAKLLDGTLKTLDNNIVTSLRSRACQGATKLVTVNLPNVTSIGTYAFYNCTDLITAILPKLTSVTSQSFYNCIKLKHADLGQASSIAAQAFNACTSLTELILRKSNAICTLSNANAITNTAVGKDTGYIYVPSALIETYKIATNWSTFADRFRALEDYTVDGTIISELDENKI